MSAVDEGEFAVMLAEATLTRAGLAPERLDAGADAAGADAVGDAGRAFPDGRKGSRARPASPTNTGQGHPEKDVLARPASDDTVHAATEAPAAPATREGNHTSADYRITDNTNPAMTLRTGRDIERLYGVPHDIPRKPHPAPPPSTLADIEGALARYEASRPRSVQRTLGPSELGTPCRRQIALKLAGVERRERGGLPWAPMCGTAVHSLMESVLQAENERLGRPRWVIEETVHLDDELKGHGDAYDSDHALVIDWKYTGTTARRKASRRTVPNADLVSMDYRVQAHLYGLGHENAGRPVRHVRLVMLARSHDFRESVEWTEEYRPDIAISAMTRFYATRDQVVNLDAATHPERLAAIAATPGDACKWCPFQRIGPEVDATGCAGNTAASTDPAAFFR